MFAYYAPLVLFVTASAYELFSSINDGMLPDVYALAHEVYVCTYSIFVPTGAEASSNNIAFSEVLGGNKCL